MLNEKESDKMKDCELSVESLEVDGRDGSTHGEEVGRGTSNSLIEVVESLKFSEKESGKTKDCELSVESLEVDRRDGSTRGGEARCGDGNLGWLIAVVEFFGLDEEEPDDAKDSEVTAESLKVDTREGSFCGGEM
jgi:hypothetical protein